MDTLNNRPETKDKVGEVFLWICGAACIALPIVILLVIIIRAIATRGIPLWSLDICELSMWIITYLAMGYVWRIGKHVKVTVFVDKLPDKLKNIVNNLVSALAFIISAVMMWEGLKFCITSWTELRRTENDLPEYAMSVAIPLGLLFLVYEIGRSIVQKNKNKIA